MRKISFSFTEIKPPTYGFLLYILLIPFEAILALPSFVVVSFATLAALFTSVSILLYLAYQPRLLKPTKNVIPWLAFMIWSGFSIYWSADRSLSIYNYIFIFKQLFFLILISSYPFNSSEKRIIRHTIILSGILLSLDILLSTYQVGGISTFVRATIANGFYKADPNHIASSLLLPIAFLIAEYAEEKTIRMWEVIASIILFSTLIVTGSRGAFLAFLFMVLTFLVLYHNKHYSKKLINILILLLAIAGLVVAFLIPDLLNRFAPINNIDRYSANRITVWTDSLKLWQEKPIQGYGFGIFAELPMQVSVGVKTAHNIFVQALAEGGLIGFFLLIAAVIPTISFKTYDRFSRASKAGVIGIFGTSLFLYTLNYDYFWLVMIAAEISRRSHVSNTLKATID